jgi:hypothetical protein
MTGEQVLSKLKGKGQWKLTYQDLPFPEYLLENGQGMVVKVATRTGDMLIMKGLIKRGSISGPLPSGGKIIELVLAC